MGYCWTSGRKINGRWHFDKCNGNKQLGPGNCFPESTKEHPRCRDCAEWRKTYKEAKEYVEEWERLNKTVVAYKEWETKEKRAL